MAENRYDVIVLGLGVMGSATAYQLAKDGLRVLALEQFQLDHRMGSSYGESRIIRYAYDHPVYIDMVKKAFSMWRELEAEAGQQVMFRTGGLDFGKPDAPTLTVTRNNLKQAGIAHEWLSAAAVHARFPQFQLEEDMYAVYQADAAYLQASLCVITLAEMARNNGATLLTGVPVTGIEVLTDSVRVRTADAQYEAAKLVITAGPWAARVLAMLDLQLPLQPTREQIVFFQPLEPDLFTPERCPVFISHSQPWHYGLPNVDGNGLKAAIHCNDESTDPDTCKRTADEDYIERIQNFVARYLPKANGRVNDSRVCLY